MIFDKLASAIRNDVVGGLKGYHSNLSMNLEQLKDDIVDERLQIIKEYQLKGILPTNDLLLSINCIPVDCKDLEKCSKCQDMFDGTPTMHFEIPQLLLDYGINPISYIGTIDKQNPYQYYTDAYSYNLYHKYRRRGKQKPYIWIDIAPNENGMLDCFVFNAPLLKKISIVGMFKDPRQLEQYGCCDPDNKSDDNFSWINSEIKRRLTLKKLQFYRQYSPINKPNDQAYTEG